MFFSFFKMPETGKRPKFCIVAHPVSFSKRFYHYIEEIKEKLEGKKEERLQKVYAFQEILERR